MNGLKKSVVVTLLSATVLYPRLAPAMEIQMFDDMATQDQRDYLKFLVKGAQKVLIEQGRRDLAAKVQQLFHEIHPGDHRSLGEAQFEASLGKMRAFIAENPNSPLRFQFESVLIQTLYNNGIQPSREFQKRLAQVVREKPFWPKLPLHDATSR